MLTIHTSSLRATSNEAAHAPVTGGTSAAAGFDPAGFASLLRQTQAAPHAPAPEPVAAVAAAATPTTRAGAPNADAPHGTPAPQDNDPANPDDAGLAAKPRTASKVAAAPGGFKPAAKPPGTSEPAPTQPAVDESRAAPAMHQAAGSAPIDPSLLHWLAAMPRAGAGEASGTPGTVDGQAASTDPTQAADGNTRGTSHDLRARDPRNEADAARPGPAVSDGHCAAAPAGPGIKDKPQADHAGAFIGIDAAAARAQGIAAAPPGAARTETAAPLAVAIATPVTAPEFPRTLGLQMSVLARDGVQQAELHLNPAEMGPVSVQIVMDGTRAHVDFGADVAATRQAIEAGLPELASALRDAGFTLAGGGVSQHSRGRNGDETSSRGTRRVAGGDATAATDAARHVSRRTVSVGGIDLYV